jgi:hypothetical protein
MMPPAHVIDVELMVQRFLDQELSAEERMQFVVRLGRDDALRERVIAFEQLLVATRELPRPLVPERFVERVIRRTEPAPPAWRRFAGALVAPRTLQWNVASAAVAALVFLAAATAVYLLRPATRGAVGGGAPVVSAPGAAPPATVPIRLVIVRPGARTVEVAGDFNGWDPLRTPLEPVSDGAWTVTIPLEPGRYKYMFLIDGREWVTDPFAAERADDGFGSENAVLDVRPMGAV